MKQDFISYTADYLVNAAIESQDFIAGLTEEGV